MGYLDTTDREMIALAYKRRRERLVDAVFAENPDCAEIDRAYFRLHGQRYSDPIRYSTEPPETEFSPVVACVSLSARSKTRAKAWRVGQWQEGNRSCAYCKCEMQNIPRHVRRGAVIPLNRVTVDHREPLALGGDDAPWNYAMCCYDCNNRKGRMTEAEFRRMLVLEVSVNL